VKTHSFEETELEDAWVEGEPAARWSSAAGHSANGSASSLLEVPPGCRLARHTDSAEEVIVVASGRARVTVGAESCELGSGGVAVVPECVPHLVENAGDTPLRFVAVYASAQVVTTYAVEIQPGGERERRPAG
jgi:quercetin dioxygenase-like cupin family protein